MTCRYRYDDGAYVLAALSPAERAQFEQHLANCLTCASSVRHLAPLPGLLGRVDPVVAEQDLPGSSRLPRLLDVMSSLRRRQTRLRRLRLAAVGLAAALIAGAGVMVVASGDDGQQIVAGPLTEEMVPVASYVPVTAKLDLTERDTGTTVTMDCRYLAGYSGLPQTFRLIAVGSDGSDDPLGSWSAGPGDQVEMASLTRFTGTDLARIELRDAAGTVLLIHEP